MTVKGAEHEAGEQLEFYGPPLPPEYEPPGLWDEQDEGGES